MIDSLENSISANVKSGNGSIYKVIMTKPREGSTFNRHIHLPVGAFVADSLIKDHPAILDTRSRKQAIAEISQMYLDAWLTQSDLDLSQYWIDPWQ